MCGLAGRGIMVPCFPQIKMFKAHFLLEPKSERQECYFCANPKGRFFVRKATSSHHMP